MVNFNKRNTKNFYPEEQARTVQLRAQKARERTDSVLTKAEQITIDKWKKASAYVTKWEDYREQKIEMTAIYIKVLKRKNFCRRWFRLQKLGQIFAKVVENLRIRRFLNHILFTSIVTAIRWKVAYRYRHCRQFGGGWDDKGVMHRRRNQLRHALTAAA